MKNNIGFDNKRYLQEQTAAILERVKMFGNTLYLEFGGKLLFDYHASRVLPGFHPNVKMELLQKLKDRADIVLCIYAGDIEREKVRADFGITYDADALKLIDDFKDWGLEIAAVVITRFDNQPAAKIFKNKLERRGIRVCVHRFTKGYPTDVNTIVSDEGYGSNEYIETKKQLVVVTGPGPGSGKLATCLSQLYHEHKRGVQAGYAKLETFPVWNLPLKHPVNVAYEAATADIMDFILFTWKPTTKPPSTTTATLKSSRCLKGYWKKYREQGQYISPPRTWVLTGWASPLLMMPLFRRRQSRSSSGGISGITANTLWALWRRWRCSGLSCS